MGLPTATVKLRGPDNMVRTATGMGTGPVDASFKAIDSIVRVQVLLVYFLSALVTVLVSICAQAAAGLAS